MRRWLLWLICPIGASILVFLKRAWSSGLLADTDTIGILGAIRETKNPFAWFGGDWPLHNHFYRPISTLFFEFDNWAYKTNAAGYGLTNCLIAIGCIFLLFWMVRELFDSPWLAGVSSLVFGLWHISGTYLSWLNFALVCASVLVLVGVFRGWKNIGPAVLASLGLYFLATQFMPLQELNFRMIAWLPGRTASVMLLFCLLSLASYARWERLTSRKDNPKPTAEDVPATKGTDATAQAKMPWIWLALTIVGLLLALGSYEQAVMLPAVLLGFAVIFKTSGRSPHWGVHAIFWAVLVGYVAFRHNIIPAGTSKYQAQQFRDGPGVLMDAASYFFPPVNSWRNLAAAWTGDIALVLTEGFWKPFLELLSGLAIFVLIWKDKQRWAALGMMLLSAFSFLPMAWLKMFEHYHYWPSALRAVYLLIALGIVIRAAINAVSPQAIQAPRRSDPAPGSLVRP